MYNSHFLEDEGVQPGDIALFSANSSIGNDSASASKKKRFQVNSACTQCKRVHTACSTKRPCDRCVSMGEAHLCMDIPRKRRTKKKLIQQPSPLLNSLTPNESLSLPSAQSLSSLSSLPSLLSHNTPSIPSSLPQTPSCHTPAPFAPPIDELEEFLLDKSGGVNLTFSNELQNMYNASPAPLSTPYASNNTFPLSHLESTTEIITTACMNFNIGAPGVVVNNHIVWADPMKPRCFCHTLKLDRVFIACSEEQPFVKQAQRPGPEPNRMVGVQMALETLIREIQFLKSEVRANKSQQTYNGASSPEGSNRSSSDDDSAGSEEFVAKKEKIDEVEGGRKKGMTGPAIAVWSLDDWRLEDANDKFKIVFNHDGSKDMFLTDLAPCTSDLMKFIIKKWGLEFAETRVCLLRRPNEPDIKVAVGLNCHFSHVVTTTLWM